CCRRPRSNRFAAAARPWRFSARSACMLQEVCYDTQPSGGILRFSFTGRSSMRQLFAVVAILAAVGAVRATDGEVKCKADGVHLCCGKCVKSVQAILGK